MKAVAGLESRGLVWPDPWQMIVVALCMLDPLLVPQSFAAAVYGGSRVGAGRSAGRSLHGPDDARRRCGRRDRTPRHGERRSAALPGARSVGAAGNASTVAARRISL